MTGRTRVLGWAVALAAVAVLVIAGARRTPTSGISEDRLYSLAGQMKCLQCAGETVAGSQADIAIKMRTEIRAQMRKGRTDDEILGYFADRYGQRVLLNPSGKGVTSLVWIIPVIAGASGILWLTVKFAGTREQRRAAAAIGVSEDDRELVRRALVDGED